MTSITLPRSDIAGLAAVDMGRRHPVVLLHGVGLRAEAWHPQIEALQKSYRVVAPDMPGHGQSPCPDGEMDLPDYVRATLPLLERLDEPVLVIGHSMGAMIALELAAQAPAHVCAVVALNAIFERTSQAAEAVQARAASLDTAQVHDPTETLQRWFGDRTSPERALCEQWLREADPRGYKLAYTAFAHCDGPDRSALQGLACPALFITGALEPNSTPQMSETMSALAPQGRAQIVEGAAHMMPLTHADAVNAAILALAQEVWP